MLHEVRVLRVDAIAKVHLSISDVLVCLRHQPPHTTIISCLGEQQHIQSRYCHNILPEKRESSNEAKEIEALAPNG
jgi:hypothetical protein